MSNQTINYLAISGTNGEGFKVLIWGDPQGELEKIQARIDSGEVFTSVTVNTNGNSSSTQELTFDSPVAACQLLPLEPTVVKGAVAQQGGQYIFTPEQS